MGVCVFAHTVTMMLADLKSRCNAHRCGCGRVLLCGACGWVVESVSVWVHNVLADFLRSQCSMQYLRVSVCVCMCVWCA